MRQKAMVWRNSIYHGSFICRCGADLLKLNATAYQDSTHVLCRRCGYVVAEIEEIEAPEKIAPGVYGDYIEFQRKRRIS